MADRAGEQTKSRDVDELLAEVNDGATDADEGETRQHASRGTDQQDPTLRERAGQLFSPRVFLVALLLSVVGVALGGSIPILGTVLGFVGVFLAAFALGTVSDGRHYPETGVAGAVAAGGWSVLGNVTLFALVGLPFFAASAGIGLLCGLLGHYFGRDLRDGLTREI